MQALLYTLLITFRGPIPTSIIYQGLCILLSMLMRWAFSHHVSRVSNKAITKLRDWILYPPHSICLLPTQITKYPSPLCRQSPTFETPVLGENKVINPKAPDCRSVVQNHLWFCHFLEEIRTKYSSVARVSYLPMILSALAESSWDNSGSRPLGNRGDLFVL